MALLLLTQLNPIPSTYRYIAVYSGTSEDLTRSRLQILYSLLEHEPPRDPSTGQQYNYAGFASFINDYWNMPTGGYQMLAGESVADFPETIDTEALRQIVSEDDIMGWPPNNRQRNHEEEQAQLERIKAAWINAVGADVAKNAQPVEIIRDRLVIEVRSSAWAQQIGFLAGRIQRVLNIPQIRLCLRVARKRAAVTP